ncbi:unnamed protein product [Auanema sp. JU1783]|nr:unnamed protein product [Auanema sp. JU1783]
MIRRFVLLLLTVAVLSVFFLVTLVGIDDEFHGYETSQTYQKEKDSNLKMILVGDTGGMPIIHTTSAQNRAAKTMSDMSDERGLDLVINTGDNIYYTGAVDEFDDRFQTSFEKPYTAIDVPWYMIAGNHDHFGNISAQIAYTNHSRKWKFPSLYYKVSEKTKDGATIDILMIDTIVLCGNSRDIEFAGFWKMVTAKSHTPEGPVNVTAANLQYKWLETNLKNSTADYLFVVGHYPVYSVSSHGPTQCMIDNVIPYLAKYNVTAYISGHDHSLQHFVGPNPIHKDKEINYIVTGAGSRSDPSGKNKNSIPGDVTTKFHFPKSGWIIKQLGFSDAGFIYTAINSHMADLSFVDKKGRILYATYLYPRKGRISKETESTTPPV